MLTKSIYWVLAVVVVLTALLPGCQSRKIAYGNSYYFPQTPRTTAPESERRPEVLSSLEVTLDPEVSSPASLLEEARKRLERVATSSDHQALKEQALHVTRLAQTGPSDGAGVRDKRLHRKALRKEIKQLKKQIYAAPNETQAIDRTLKIALILLVAGLALGFIPFLPLQIVGWIAFVAGLVFLLIWLINEA